MVGHIKIDRKILNWEWYQDVNMFHLFLYLLLKANHKEGNWKGVPIKRGQLITGRLKVSKDTGLTEREIRTCLNKLKTTNEIAIKSTSKFSLITICKYDVYQSNNFTSDQQKDQQPVQSASGHRPTNDQQTTINNNVNNNKEDKKVFINKPLPENFNGLPEIKIGSVIQLLKITKQTDVSPEDVSGLWEVFKIQNLTGKKFYDTEDDVYSHFINWSKTQTFNNGIAKTKTTGGTDFKSKGADVLTERIKTGLSKIDGLRKGNIE